MQFIKQNDGSLNIIVADEDDYECTDDNGVDVILSPEQLSELVSVVSPHQPAAPTKEQCRKYWLYRADSGHLYHLLYDLLGEMPTEDTLGDALCKARDQAATIRNETLGAFEKMMRDRIEGIMKAYDGETNPKITSRPFSMADGMNECILMLNSLRTSTNPQEQPAAGPAGERHIRESRIAINPVIIDDSKRGNAP